MSQPSEIPGSSGIRKLQNFRQRRVFSCVNCHTKKIKCDRNPAGCYGCKNTGIECKYYTNRRRSPRRGIKNRQELLHSQPPQSDILGASLVPLSSPLLPRHAWESSQLAPLRDLGLETSSMDLSFSRPITPRASSRPAVCKLRSENIASANDMIRPYGAVYPGIRHWNSNSCDLNSHPRHSIPALLVNTPQYDSGVPVHKSSATTQNFLGELSKSLPRNREQSQKLVERYGASVRPLFPCIIDFDCFMSRHTLFCSIMFDMNVAHAPSHLVASLDLISFYAEYFAVLVAATIAEFEEHNDPSLTGDISNYRQAFLQVRAFLQYPNGSPSISLLAGSILIEVTASTVSRNDILDLVAYARRLQLDRIPVAELEIGNEKMLIRRGAMWLTVFGLDAVAAKEYCATPTIHLACESFPILKEDRSSERKLLDIGLFVLIIRHMYHRIVNLMAHHFYRDITTCVLTVDVVKMLTREIALLHDGVQRKLADLTRSHQQFPPLIEELTFSNFVRAHVGRYVDQLLLWLHVRLMRTTLQSLGGSTTMPYVCPGGTMFPLSNAGIPLEALSVESVMFLTTPPLSMLLPGNINEFSYCSLETNLVPSLVHSLGKYLESHDSIRFRRFNWYVKQSMPGDRLAMMLFVYVVKLKHQSVLFAELELYTSIIGKVLNLVNRNWSKAEDCQAIKCMFNIVWEMILSRFKPFEIFGRSKTYQSGDSGSMVNLVGRLKGVTNEDHTLGDLRVPRPIRMTQYAGTTQSTLPSGVDGGLLIQSISGFNSPNCYLPSLRVPPVTHYALLSTETKDKLDKISHKFDLEASRSSLNYHQAEPAYARYHHTLVAVMAFIKGNFML